MPWFRSFGLLYLPVRPMGILITAAILAFCVHIFLHVDARSHSVSDTLYGTFPYIVPALLFWQWIAERTACNRLTS